MRTMNRFLAFFLALLTGIPVILLASCSRMNDVGDGEAESYKLGLGVVVSNDSSTTGKAEQAVTIAAVLMDENGEIVDAAIDCADSSLDITDGKVTHSGVYLTKNELGDDYGMGAISPIRKEWYEQAEYLSKHVRGMDAKEVSSIALSDAGKAEETDLSSGCTIDITDLKEALIKAAGDAEAVSFSTEAMPALSLAAMTDDSGSSDATADKDGSASMVTTVAAVAEADGKVCASIIDVAQPSFSFNTAGEVTDKQFGGTKRELGNDYGMKSVSSIGKEWYEQEEAFCKFIAGMDAEEISKIELDDAGKATDTDLKAGCTIGISDFVKIAVKALEAADK